MYAVVEISGKQYKVEKGQEIVVDLQDAGKKKLSFETVTIYRGDKEDIKIGTPYVKGMTVDAEVVEPLVKGDKLTVFKYKNKTNYRVKTGHRQKYTQLKISGIKEKSAPKAEKKEAVVEEKAE